jgi:sugar phosphate isomerase/epimerase
MPERSLDAFGLLERAERLGVKVVQICDNLSLARLRPEEVAALLERARWSGIALEVGTRGLDPEDLRAHLRIALDAGAPFVRVVIDRRGDEPSPAEAVSRIRAVLPEFAGAGVKLAVENHDRFPAATLAKMVRELGEDHVGVCLDTVNSLGALETPMRVLEELAPLVLSLHVKDFAIRRVSHQMGFVVEGCPAGEGRLDVRWILETLKAGGRDPNAILELWTPPGRSLQETIEREEDWASRSVRYLRTLIPD